MPNDPKPKVAVSYSWKEEREGQNANAVNDFCIQLRAGGIGVLHDVDHMEYGESISRFMQSLGASDCLCVFLSDNYLRSQNCMYELLVAWQRSKDNSQEFRKRVKCWVMPGFSGISDPALRTPYLEFWQNEDKESAKRVKKHGTKGLSAASQKQYNTIHEIARSFDLIMASVGDTLSPGTGEEFEKWIRSCFPNAKPGDGTVNVSDVYQNIVHEINSILDHNDFLPLREFLLSAAPTLLMQRGSEYQLNPAVAAGSLDLVPVLRGISERLKIFSAKRELWTALGEICGGLVVLGIDPKWVAAQREKARLASVELAADNECFNIGAGRQVNWLHLVTCALGDGRARLEKVFGKPAIDEKRLPDLPQVAKGILAKDRLHEIKLHFIEFVLRQKVQPDADVELLFRRTQKAITFAARVEHQPHHVFGEFFELHAAIIRNDLDIKDLLLIHPSGGDPEELLTDHVYVLSFLGKIFDAVQAHTGRITRK